MIVMLTWLWIAGTALLLGAEINRAAEETRRAQSSVFLKRVSIFPPRAPTRSGMLQPWPKPFLRVSRHPRSRCLPMQDQKVRLSDFRGRTLIMAFYPADWSPVCTDQMALYNEILPEFKVCGADLGGHLD